MTSEESAANQPAHHPVVANPIGLSVRTNLRAGLAWNGLAWNGLAWNDLAWNDLDDKAQELWSSLTDSVSGAVSGFGNSA